MQTLDDKDVPNVEDVPDIGCPVNGCGLDGLVALLCLASPEMKKNSVSGWLTWPNALNSCLLIICFFIVFCVARKPVFEVSDQV